MTTSPNSRRDRAALTALVVVAVVALVVLGARGAGVLLLEVKGGSMEPTITNGSLLVSVPTRSADVATGDVVSIHDDQGRRVTHRVVDVDPAGRVVTRGDANTIDDPQAYTGDRLDLVVAAVPGATLARAGQLVGVALVALVAVGVLNAAALLAGTRRHALVHQVVIP